MINEQNYRVTVASVPQPRKNKRVIKGKFNIMDFIVIVPAIGVFVALLLTGTWPFWVTIIILVGLIAVVGILIWPLSFLGKEKLYIYVARAVSYAFTKQSYGSAPVPRGQAGVPREGASSKPQGGGPDQGRDPQGRQNDSLPPDLLERLRRRRRRG